MQEFTKLTAELSAGQQGPEVQMEGMRISVKVEKPENYNGSKGHVPASPPDSRAQDRSGTQTNDSQTQRYNYNHVTFNNIQDPPPHSGLNVRTQRIKKCTKGSNMIRCKKECIRPTKSIANVSSLPPYEECASLSTKERKEKQNSDTEKPLQSANETHHELITDHVWRSCNL